MSQWESEFATWAPHFNVVTFHGSKLAREIITRYELSSHTQLTEFQKFDVAITTYERVLSDAKLFKSLGKRRPWRCIVVDEAHRLKNMKSKFAEELMKIRCQDLDATHCLLLTGTPLQVSLLTIYS